MRTIDGYLCSYYNKEEHAAHQYNLWLDKYGLTCQRNDIPIPPDFVPWKSKNEERKLPKNIYKEEEKYGSELLIKVTEGIKLLKKRLR